MLIARHYSALLAAFLGMSAVSGQITWQGFPIAASSLNKGGGKVTTLAVDGNPSGAQFPYTKDMSKKSIAPLVEVHLINVENKNFDLRLAMNFDMMSQECSCYWINATEIANKSNGTAVASSNSYQIVFRETAKEPREWASGLFGISGRGMSPANGAPAEAEAKKLEDVRQARIKDSVKDIDEPKVTFDRENTTNRTTSGFAIRNSAEHHSVSFSLAGIAMLFSFLNLAL